MESRPDIKYIVVMKKVKFKTVTNRINNKSMEGYTSRYVSSKIYVQMWKTV